MDNKDFSKIGEQIRRGVQGAIDSIDFTQLNRTISDTVNGAVRQAHDGLERARRATEASRDGQSVPQKTAVPVVRGRRPGRITGVLCTVFGGIGTGVFGMLAVVLVRRKKLRIFPNQRCNTCKRRIWVKSGKC